MRDERTLRQRPRLAWLTVAWALLSASSATAQVCNAGLDCGPGFVCATSQGVQRMRVLDYLPGTPFLAARVLQIAEPTATSPETKPAF